MKTTFALTSLRTGKLHRLSDSEVQEFYDSEILGRSKKFAEKARAQVGRLLSPFLIVGTVLLQLRNQFGELVNVSAGGNLVVDTGKAAVIDRLQGTSVGVHDWQAIGTGATAAAAGDTTLQTETGTRQQGTLSQPTATTDRLVSTFAAGNGTGSITETGRLTAVSSGNLFARQVFTAIAKGASDSLQVTHDITVS
jgi:hypothetical protein